MQNFRQNMQNNKILLIVTIILILTSLGFDGYQYWLLNTQNKNLENEVAELESTVDIYVKKFSDIRNEKTTIANKLQVEQANNDFFQGQIQNMASTVNVLEKLSKTDSELLKKYSKIYFLNENYIPLKLTNIPEKYLYSRDKPLEIHADVWPHLQKLMDDALSNNITMQVISAYRSFGTQAYLKSSYKMTYGAGTANAFSADQGYSEHQLGTTVDFTTLDIGAKFVGFDKDNVFTWLTQNAYKYGFIPSYPKSNTYYAFEPWHWRFVGIGLATKLHNENKYFYDLDQREIDQYLVNIFD